MNGAACSCQIYPCDHEMAALQRRLEEVERERDAIDVQLQQTQADYGAMEQRARTEEERANANRALQAKSEQELATERAAHKETRRAHAIDMGHARDSYELVCCERDQAVNIGLSVKAELLAERAAHAATQETAGENAQAATYHRARADRAEAALARALELMRTVPCQRVPKDPSKPCEWCLFLTKQS